MIQKSLTGRVVEGIGWQSASVVGVSIVQLVVLGVLGRHLSPSAFGLVAIANIFIGFANLFSDVGVGPALIQRQELTPGQIRGAFYLTIALGVSLAAFTAGVSSGVERFFHAAGVAAVLRWLSLSYIILGMGSVSKALLERRMAFRLLMHFEIARSIVAALVAIPMAFAGFGVWSIVASVLVGQTFLSIAMLVACAPPISPKFKWAELSSLLSYGGGLTLARFFNQLASTGDNLVVGKMMGPAALGFYERAFRVMQTPTSLLGTVMDRVLFPAMSTIQDDNTRLARGFSRAISVGYIIQVPVCIGVALLAPEIVSLLLGPGWQQSVTPLRILALSIPLRIMVRLSDSLVRAKGAVYTNASIKALFAALVILGSILGHDWGISGVAFGVFIAVVVHYLLMSSLTHRLIAVSWREHLRLMRPGAVLGAMTLLLGVPTRHVVLLVTTRPSLVLAWVAFITAGVVVAIVFRFPTLAGEEAGHVFSSVKLRPATQQRGA